MSDLAYTSALLRASPQLPVQWYNDPAIFEIEKKILLDNPKSGSWTGVVRVHRDAGQGATTRNGRSIPRRSNADMRHDGRAIHQLNCRIQDNGPGYIGHELMVPNMGDYHVLEWMNSTKMLVKNANSV